MIVELIDNAINHCRTLGVEPLYLFLTDEDYDSLKNEADIIISPVMNQGISKKLCHNYKGLIIDTRLPNEDEVYNILFSQSFICSSNMVYKVSDFQKWELKQVGRGFSLRTLEELL